MITKAQADRIETSKELLEIHRRLDECRAFFVRMDSASSTLQRTWLRDLESAMDVVAHLLRRVDQSDES